jgi:hypothetical protein
MSGLLGGDWSLTSTGSVQESDQPVVDYLVFMRTLLKIGEKIKVQKWPPRKSGGQLQGIGRIALAEPVAPS